MILLMVNRHIETPSPLSIKPAMLQKCGIVNIPQKHVIGVIAHQAQQYNIYTSEPAEVVELTQNVREQKITKKNLENDVFHAMKEQHALFQMYHILDNEMKPLFIDLAGSNDSVGSEGEIV